MNPHDKQRDRSIADALRAASGKSYPGSIVDLAARIDAAAVPLLAARRAGDQRSAVWWDYAAGWARTLIPVGVSIAAASVMVLWLMRPTAHVAAQTVTHESRSPIIAVVGRGSAAPEVVDRAVDELVSISTAPASGRRRR